jgi:RNA polymerase sigma-70 factor, ECF subfamily
METETMPVAAQNKATIEVDEDLALVQAAKSGRFTAFEKLVTKYDHIVFAVVQSILGNWEEAEDATLQAFVKAYERLSQFPPSATFSTWLLRIVVHESLARLSLQPAARKQFLNLFCANHGQSLPLEIVDWVTRPEKLYDGLELREILSNSLSSLPPTSRLVFVLRDIGGFSLRETADVLDLSRTTVQVRLFQARMQLRETLTKYFKKPVGDAGTWIPGGTQAHAIFCIPWLLLSEERNGVQESAQCLVP